MSGTRLKRSGIKRGWTETMPNHEERYDNPLFESEEAPAAEKRRLLGSAELPLEDCLAVLESGASTAEKREAAASIGRKRDPSLKPILMQYSAHANPEVALQAVRGLLVFRSDPSVVEFLNSLRNHPNDMIQDIVEQELEGNAPIEEGPHAASPDFMKNAAVQGDVLQTLEHVPSASVHLTFTSPPYYNARDYAIYGSYGEYLNFLEEAFRAVHRVTKEGRFFILNTSPVIIPRAGRKYSSRRYAVPFDLHARLTPMGWEFIDDIVWAKPDKSVKNRVAGFETNRTPLTYKANARTEYVMVYRKKSRRLIDWNLRQYSKDAARRSKVDDDFERSNVWEIAPASDRVHSAVFPLKLCMQAVKLYSFRGDLAFDPFGGSGTLGKAALLLGRYFFMTELHPQYIARMRQNVRNEETLSDRPSRFMDVSQFAAEAKQWELSCAEK